MFPPTILIPSAPSIARSRWRALLSKLPRTCHPPLPSPPAASKNGRLIAGHRRHVSCAGCNDPPQYGDYEAQRHWMEIAVHTPPARWYTDDEHNHQSHWGIDYPPVSGYQSWLFGQVRQDTACLVACWYSAWTTANARVSVIYEGEGRQLQKPKYISMPRDGRTSL